MNLHDTELHHHFPELFRARDIDADLAKTRLNARPGPRFSRWIATRLGAMRLKAKGHFLKGASPVRSSAR